MSTTATQQIPSIPPRPSRGHEQDITMPAIPPRPIKARSKSPNPDRFAQSPLNDSPLMSRIPNVSRLAKSPTLSHDLEDPIDRAGSVTMPSVGEEGLEYAAVTEELEDEKQQQQQQQYKQASELGSPRETHTVGEDVKLHAPKPSLPDSSATQRLLTVTRTDSAQAASFGIGRPSTTVSGDGGSGRAKSMTSVASNDSPVYHEDRKHVIPEIGIQVPMYPNAGDVQAPSPAPVSALTEGLKSAHSHRQTSSRNAPPGSYGMHGHGVLSDDKLDKQYYEKHPDRFAKEHLVQLHERKHDFNMSSEDLNRIVRVTASRGSGLATRDFPGTPTEDVAFLATDEYASRISTPHGSGAESPTKAAASRPELAIHVDEHRRSGQFGSLGGDKDDDKPSYTAPILAPDEVEKNTPAYEMRPAVEPPTERSGSNYEMEKPKSPPTSRPSRIQGVPAATSASVPVAIPDITAQPEQQEEEAMFSDDATPEVVETTESEPGTLSRHNTHHFPSKDIWEDTPESLQQTATVSAPEAGNDEGRRRAPAREEAETPQQAFARQHEQLAEQESRAGADAFLLRDHKKISPAIMQLQEEEELKAPRPGIGQRFPSKDVWEDAPESHMHQTTVSAPQEESESESESVGTKPSVPGRPNKQISDPVPVSRPVLHSHPKPPVTDKAKPQIPSRPSKLASSATAAEEAAAKPKPAVPPRPLGSKIAAMQAGFMSDLNKRLQLGPHAPTREESVPKENLAEETKGKTLLSDARKGRARGPQRRAPAKSPAPPMATSETNPPERKAPTLSFSTINVWSIDPDDGSLSLAETNNETGGGAKVAAVARSDGEAKEAEGAHEAAEGNTEITTDESRKDVAKETANEPQKETNSEAKPEHAIETKTLASNMAGESILAADIVKEGGAQHKVDPGEAADTVKSA